jgi:hypothetical protein
MTRQLATFVLLLAGLPWCGRATAEAPRLYDVELIVFTQHGSDDGERMVQPAAGSVRASGAFPDNQFTELSAASYTLNRVRDGLTAARGYTVLFHRAWRQLAYDRNHAVDYPVHSIATGGRNSVDGTVTLVRERYLHLDVDLLLMQAGGNAPVQYSDGAGSTPVYRLSEQRRIKSNEVHYFDHPHLGVIARVTPVQAPDQPAESDAVAPADDAPVPASEDEPVPNDAPLMPAQ